MRKKLEVLIEVPGVLQITRSDQLNLDLKIWSTDRGKNPKTQEQVADGWIFYGHYNAHSIRYPILEMVTQDDLKGEIVEVLKVIDARLETISDQIKEVAENA